MQQQHRQIEAGSGNGDIAKRAPPSLREQGREARHLVSGVVEDAKRLISSYYELLKHDARDELDRSRKTLIAATIAAYTAGTGLLLLAFAASHGLSLLSGWPLALSYLIIGGAIALVAGALLLAARRRLRTRSLPAIEEAREDVAWIRDNV